MESIYQDFQNKTHNEYEIIYKKEEEEVTSTT